MMEVFCEEYFLRKTIFPIWNDIYIPHMVMNYLLFNLSQNCETFLFSMPISRINDMFQITAVFAFLLLWFCISTSAYFCISATADFVLMILTFHLCCCRILPSADYCLSSTADFCMSITADFVFLLLLIVYINFCWFFHFCFCWFFAQFGISLNQRRRRAPSVFLPTALSPMNLIATLSLSTSPSSYFFSVFAVLTFPLCFVGKHLHVLDGLSRKSTTKRLSKSERRSSQLLDERHTLLLLWAADDYEG